MGQPTEVSAKSNVKFAKIDNSVFDPEPDPELDSKTETHREKIQRQRRERHEQSEKTWAYVQANDARYAAHRANISKHKNIDLGEFNLEEVLAHPELDAVKPVKIDPASMLADDIESLMKEGKEFVNTPTLAGAVSMAVIAIPGRVADELPIRSFLKRAKLENEINSLKVIAKKTKLVKTQVSKVSSLESVFMDVDKWSLVPISQKQKKLLVNKSSVIKQRNKKIVSQMRKKGFSKKKELFLIKTWESETGNKWPNGATPHHMIPLKNGGANEWWNLVPVKHPHTGTIHGKGSALRKELPYEIDSGTIIEIKE